MRRLNGPQRREPDRPSAVLQRPVMIQNQGKLNELAKKLIENQWAREVNTYVMWIMQEVLGLERERFLCEPDEKEGTSLKR